MTMAKKKGHEKDPENGFIFPVRRIQENYGEELRPVSSDSSSSSSSSSDEESSSECNSKESAGESAEGRPDADAGREPLAEEDRADYWVVQEDKIVRVHQTPRHDLFDPRSIEFPAPLTTLMCSGTLTPMSRDIIIMLIVGSLMNLRARSLALG